MILKEKAKARKYLNEASPKRGWGWRDGYKEWLRGVLCIRFAFQPWLLATAERLLLELWSIQRLLKNDVQSNSLSVFSLSLFSLCVAFILRQVLSSWWSPTAPSFIFLQLSILAGKHFQRYSHWSYGPYYNHCGHRDKTSWLAKPVSQSTWRLGKELAPYKPYRLNGRNFLLKEDWGDNRTKENGCQEGKNHRRPLLQSKLISHYSSIRTFFEP